MTPACRQVVATALKRDLSDAEIRNIEERLLGSMRRIATSDPVAWTAKPQADRLREAATLAAQELIAEQALKQRRAALQVLAVDRLASHLNTQAARGITGLEALDRTIAFHADARSDFLSVETQSQAIRADALRQMLGVLQSSNPKWFGLFENHEGIQAITREIFAEATGNVEAAAGAKQWKSMTTALRERFNRAGGDVGSLDDWGLPHHHSQPKVAAAGRTQWMADLLPKLDRSRYVRENGALMSDAEMSLFLSNAWETIATGGANKLIPGTFKGGSARANRGAEQRQVHFKDADSYLAYQQQYGERSLYEILVGHIDGVSKDIALVETYGPNPDQAFKLLRDRTVQAAKLADPTQIGAIDQRAIDTENLYNEVAGKRLPIASKRLANTFDTLRSWLIASRLGSAIITSFSDEATLQLTARVNQLPAMRIFANELGAMNPANRTELAMARRAGLALNTLISSLNRFGQDGLGASFSNKLANTVMRVSGLNAITEARRRAFGVTMMSSLGSVTKEHANLAALDANDFRILKAKGVTPNDFALWKRAKLEDWGGGNDTMLTPDAIYRIPDSEIDVVIAPEQAKIRTDAQGEIDALNAKDLEERAWLTKRTTGLSDWVAKQQAALTTSIAKASGRKAEKLQELSAKLTKLDETIDLVASTWKGDAGPDAPAIDRSQSVGFYSKGALRKLGIDEGRAIEATKRLNAQVRQVAEAFEAEKLKRIAGVFEQFNERRAELDDFVKRLNERGARRTEVARRIEREIDPALEASRTKAREQAATRLLGVVLEESNVAIIEPGAKERAFTGAQIQRGTWKGELTRSFFLFKSFPIAMITRHWQRGMSLPNAGGRAAYIATLIAGTTIAGVASMQVNELLSGRDPRNLNPAEKGGTRNWMAALLKGGSLGIYGDLLFSDTTRYGGSPVASLMGPVIGLGEDAFNLTQGNVLQSLRGEDPRLGAEAVKFARGNLPGASLWYTKAALDHLIFHQLQEYFSPGYLANMRSRAERDFGQKYWWEPGEVAPDRAPNLGATVGQ